MWPANYANNANLTRPNRAALPVLQLRCGRRLTSGSYKDEIESVKEARQKDEHRNGLTCLTKSPEALAKAPEVMKVEKRSDRDVGNRKPETSFAANIETRGSPTE